MFTDIQARLYGIMKLVDEELELVSFESMQRATDQERDLAIEIREQMEWAARFEEPSMTAGARCTQYDS